jgi:hypothetical protein
MQNEWPHLLADFKAKRDALNAIIATIETHFTIPDSEGARPTREEQPRRGRKVGRNKKIGKRALKKRTNERTNERARTAPARSAEPP